MVGRRSELASNIAVGTLHLTERKLLTGHSETENVQEFLFVVPLARARLAS
jgi:hypothetical protein